MSIWGVTTGYMHANDIYSTKKASHTKEYRQILEKKLDAQAEVIRDGEINPSFQMRAEHKKLYEERVEN